MNKLMRKLGFSLIEVILGSVIIAGFVGTTVYTAGEIGMARREALANKDRNSWATLQTQYAAEGVSAPSSETKVWGDGTTENFGRIIPKAGKTSSLYVNSQSDNIDASSVTTKGTVGKSLCINAFNLSNLGKASTATSRFNQNTVGLMLMDRASYSTATTNNGGVIDPTNDPMKKPDGLFALSTSIAIAKFDTATGTYKEVPASSVTIDALKELNWTGSEPAFYVLIKSTSGTIDSATCSLNGSTSISMSTSLPSGVYGYAGAFPVTIDDLKNMGSSLLNISTSAYNTAADLYSYGKGAVTINPVKPTLLHQRIKHPVVDPPSVTTSSVVNIYDVLHSANKEYYSFSSGVAGLNGTDLSTLEDSATSNQYLKANTDVILSKLTLYDYIESTVIGGTTTKTLSVLSLGTSGYNEFNAQASHFDSAGTAFNWITTNRLAGVTAYNALIAPATSISTPLTITTTLRPTVAFSPVSGSTIESNSGVTAYASNTVMSSGAEDMSPTPPLYYIYYNYGTSSMDGVATPSVETHQGVIQSYTGSVNMGTLADGATVYVKAIALATPDTDINGNDPYKLFLTSSPDAQASGKYTYDSDVYKVLAYVNILDNINGYVQGSIQVRDACNFNANGSAAVGFELRLNFEPKFTLNGNSKNNFKYYSTTADSAYYASTSDIITAVQNNSTKVQIISPSKTYTLDNQSFYTPTSSNYQVQLNITPISIETSIAPKDPEGVYASAYSGCTDNDEVKNKETLTLVGGNTYYYNSLTIRNGGTITVSGSGTAILYVKSFTIDGGTIGKTGDASALNVYALNNVTFNSGAEFIGKLHCGTYFKTSTVSPTTSDGYLHNYSSGTVTLNGQCIFTGKIWCYELNMNGQCQLLIQ